jgi:hypothetical protein
VPQGDPQINGELRYVQLLKSAVKTRNRDLKRLTWGLSQRSGHGQALRDQGDPRWGSYQVRDLEGYPLKPLSPKHLKSLLRNNTDRLRSQ